MIYVDIQNTTVFKRFKFSSAHFLPEHDGKCRNMHGHNYTVELGLSGLLIEEGPKKGMVVDFGDMKDWFDEVVNQPLDHEVLNETELFEDWPPTAEVLANWIWNEAVEYWSDYDVVVRVWETDDSYVEVG
jgi:6-pyruvoyltetrahydropterin/6-carboxytetrahydropterin synthase